MRNYVSSAHGQMLRTLCTGIALLCTIPTVSLHSQTMRGMVKDGNSGVPIADASVVLMDSDGKIQRGTLTEPDGSFVLVAPDEGLYTLRVGAASYAVQNTPPLSVLEGQEAQVDILLRVEDQPAGPPPGFTQRMALGEGQFITREQIDESPGDRFTDIFQFTPAVAVVPMPAGSRMNAAESTPGYMTSYSRRSDELSGGARQYMTLRIKAGRDFKNRVVGAVQQGEPVNECVPVIWVDGIWWGNIDRAGPDGPDGAFALGDIEAIEVYNHPSVLPEQFNSGRDSLCGVVVVWRKQSSKQ
jgi:hypothetical protein